MCACAHKRACRHTHIKLSNSIITSISLENSHWFFKNNAPAEEICHIPYPFTLLCFVISRISCLHRPLLISLLLHGSSVVFYLLVQRCLTWEVEGISERLFRWTVSGLLDCVPWPIGIWGAVPGNPRCGDKHPIPTYHQEKSSSFYQSGN